MLLIGRTQGDATLRHALAWEMAEQLHKAPDSSFMNITEETGSTLYKGSQVKAEIVAKKRLTEQQVLEQYLGDYKQRIIVEGNSVDKFLGHYSLTTTVHPFSAGILLLKGNVLCVVGGDSRPSYIFDAGAGTLERTENLYTSLYAYVPDNASISAYIVSTETMPVAITLEEEKKKEFIPLPSPKKSTKRAILEEEEEKKAESPKKKAALVEEKEEGEAPTPKKVEEEEEEKVPSSPVKKKKKSEEGEDEEEGKSGKKSAVGRSRHRRKLATEGQQQK